MPALAEIAHRRGAMFAAIFDPISLGLLARPGDYGADIAVAEGQCLGNPMSLRRAVPGDDGLPGGVRPPHARPARRPDRRSPRQSLLGVDPANPRTAHPPRQGHQQHLHQPGAFGPAGGGLFGVRGPGRAARRWPRRVCKRPATPPRGSPRARRCRRGFARPTFKEFVVRVPGGRVEELVAAGLWQNIFAGVPLETWYPELADCLLVAVTEKRTKAEIDRLAD